MPSHIFVRLGLWDETIATNQRSFDAGFEYARAHQIGVAPEQFHALDYMVYAYLQQGRDAEARRTVARAQELKATLTADQLVANYNRVAMEARISLERSDWAAASRLPVRSRRSGRRDRPSRWSTARSRPARDARTVPQGCRSQVSRARLPMLDEEAPARNL